MLKKFKKVVKYSTNIEEHIVNVSGNIPRYILLLFIRASPIVKLHPPTGIPTTYLKPYLLPKNSHPTT